jgi:hypothetical protein
MALKILIATPAYGDMVYTGYHESVAGLVSAFARAAPGIVFEQKVINVPVLATARNILASMVIADPSYSHLLFVDADMAFSPSLIAKMLQSKRPFVASVYPEKLTHWKELGEELAKDRMPTMQARLVTSSYVCGKELWEEETASGKRVIRMVGGLCRIGLAGTGVMLIAREALVALQARFPELWVEHPAEEIRERGLETGGLMRCFDTFVNEDGYLVGEDIAFCHRWRQTGGDIWVVMDEAIVHQGIARFMGHALIAMKSDPTNRVRGVSQRARGREDPWFKRVLAATAP